MRKRGRNIWKRLICLILAVLFSRSIVAENAYAAPALQNIAIEQEGTSKVHNYGDVQREKERTKDSIYDYALDDISSMEED